MARARSRRRSRKARVLHVKARGGHRLSFRTRLALRLAVVAAALGLVGWASYLGLSRVGRFLFTENEQFALRRIEVETDGSLPPSLLRDFTGVAPGQNLFAIRLPEVQARLLGVPLVRTAQVSRELPDRLRVEVTERVPLARIGDPRVDFALLVDRDGRLMASGPGLRHLPLITGLTLDRPEPGRDLEDPRARDALRLIEHAGTTHLKERLPVRSVDAQHPAYLLVELATGERARVARSNLELRLVHFAATLQAEEERGRRIGFIDLTVDSNFPVVRP